MWNESATRARLPTAVPTPNSRKRKTVSTEVRGGESEVSEGEEESEEARRRGREGGYWLGVA